jgi:hypothetical protein
MRSVIAALLIVAAVIGLWLRISLRGAATNDQTRESSTIAPQPESQHPASPFCPISKPSEIPPGLNLSLSSTSEEAEQAELAELEALAQKRSTPEAANALRWLIHQGDRNETLRNEAVKVLLAWNPDWLVPDLIRMSLDPAQTETWRGWCVQYLEHHYARYRDEPALKGIMDAAAHRDDPIRRKQGMFSFAVLSRDLGWQKSDPEHFKALSAELERALADSAGAPAVLEAALDAIREAEVTSLRSPVEKLAADEKQELPIRVAAVRALASIGTAESLPVLEKCAASKLPTLIQFSKLAITAIRTRSPEHP